MRSGGCLSAGAPNTRCQLSLAGTPLSRKSALPSAAVALTSTSRLTPWASSEPSALRTLPSLTRTLPSTTASRGCICGASWILAFTFASSLPSIPANVSPALCKDRSVLWSSISNATASGPCPLRARWPVRGNGSSRSTAKVPLRESLRPSDAAMLASGTVNSTARPSSRNSPRGISSAGHPSTSASSRLVPSRARETRSPDPTGAQSALVGPAPCTTLKCPARRLPRTNRRDTQPRVAGVTQLGHNVLKVAADIGPILASS